MLILREVYAYFHSKIHNKSRSSLRGQCQHVDALELLCIHTHTSHSMIDRLMDGLCHILAIYNIYILAGEVTILYNHYGKWGVGEWEATHTR